VLAGRGIRCDLFILLFGFVLYRFENTSLRVHHLIIFPGSQVRLTMSFQPDPDSLPLPGEVHENEWYNQDFGGFEVSEQFLFKKRHVRLVVVGAGAVGVQVAYKAPQELEDYKLTIYEKNDDLGGTCNYFHIELHFFVERLLIEMHRARE
jgi:hypothetical protein